MSLSAPASQSELYAYAKAKLGSGINKINVTDDQMDVAFGDAVEMFDRHHFDASERRFVARQVSDQEASQKSLILDSTVIDVIRVLGFGSALSTANVLWVPGNQGFSESGWMVDSGVAGGFGNLDVGVGPYGRTNAVSAYLSAMQAAEYENIYVGEPIFEFNSLSKRLSLDVGGYELSADMFIVFEGLVSLYAAGNTAIFNSDWLKRYFTTLVKRQWGENISKFDGNILGVDVKLNWQKIVEEAQRDKGDLETELQATWSAVPMFRMG